MNFFPASQSVDTGAARSLLPASRWRKLHQQQPVIRLTTANGTPIPTYGCKHLNIRIGSMVKKDGSSRPCGDYRRLNMLTEADHYPLPNIADVTSFIQGTKIFSKFDLLKGYYQVPMHPEDIPKTAVPRSLVLTLSTTSSSSPPSVVDKIRMISSPERAPSRRRWSVRMGRLTTFSSGSPPMRESKSESLCKSGKGNDFLLADGDSERILLFIGMTAESSFLPHLKKIP
ncbi:uncharacterized protein LOC119594287 [Penaeus monodon]|uniref:uncharacterized protein LOC119594287 n=1 Tax=Penaeus monodon TaxID=6687 RepID=UPI0018A7399E|nr:uncharacterized protein LOC119594287 [Penaeus monodon]